MNSQQITEFRKSIRIGFVRALEKWAVDLSKLKDSNQEHFNYYQQMAIVVSGARNDATCGCGIGPLVWEHLDPDGSAQNKLEKKSDDRSAFRFSGQKWHIIRETFSGLYVEAYFELDRNTLGRVTLIPAHGWDKEKQATKNHGHWTAIDRNIDELFTEEQAAQRLVGADKLHPAMTL